MVTVQLVWLAMQVVWVSMAECTGAPPEPVRLVRARVAPAAPRVVQEEDAAQVVAEVVEDAVAVAVEVAEAVEDAEAEVAGDAVEAKQLN